MLDYFNQLMIKQEALLKLCLSESYQILLCSALTLSFEKIYPVPFCTLLCKFN
ncbi:MAG: hypothetical protein CLLPBCKN_005909 [Chroococcidiopsis cubana SAG 39.79]|nr:hypothetical protein [Chroococcidiopsis cubana SAG 39.79]